MDGRPTLWVRRFIYVPKRFHLDLHKMVGKDDPNCFHTHPAYAIRIVLWGGYIEEMENGRHRTWLPGMIGIVPPSLSHRIVGLRNGHTSYSLWIRFRKRASVLLRGDGWARQQQTHRVKDTVLAQAQGEVQKQ